MSERGEHRFVITGDLLKVAAADEGAFKAELERFAREARAPEVSDANDATLDDSTLDEATIRAWLDEIDTDGIVDSGDLEALGERLAGWLGVE